MEENEQLKVLMAGFRGTNLDESDFASAGISKLCAVSCWVHSSLHSLQVMSRTVQLTSVVCIGMATWHAGFFCMLGHCF